jgi:hypothetical protein
MKRVRLAALLAVVVLVTAACNERSAKYLVTTTTWPATTNLRGELILNGANLVRGNLSDCAGAGPYADLVEDAPVLVNGADGRPLAVGKIFYAVGTNVYQNRLDQCTFKILVSGIPRQDTYQVIVGQQKPLPTTFFDIYARQGQVRWYLNPVPGSPTTTTTIPFPTSTTRPGTGTTGRGTGRIRASTTTTTLPIDPSATTTTLPDDPNDPVQ